MQHSRSYGRNYGKKGDFPVLFAERVRRQLLHPKAKKKRRRRGRNYIFTLFSRLDASAMCSEIKEQEMLAKAWACACS
ncbi:hypothetical protein RRG08_043661 [Elysia crispata]|uniref:Uncharacterized protein n=1 Tax=Elysia crispata TaxID=231223 RepID=A0AAE0ZW41_9GAST|nr:hypothetical protein RRG08_043661 [Elysia crispata]